MGGGLTSVSVGGCTRAVARSNGGLALALDTPEADGQAVVTVSVRLPTVKAWRAAATTSCRKGGSRSPSRARVVGLWISSNVATPTGDEVRADLEKRYVEGIKRCHERALRLDAAASGGVRVIYRILENGAASFTSVNGFDSAVDTCIESLVGKWRFAVPRDGGGKPTTADVDVTLFL